jgi:peptidoglycan/LPS O-acetylase OafA/YrhL
MPSKDIRIMDALRGIAIINVLVLHTFAFYTGKLPIYQLFGAMAVPLFFAVSGFCICYGIFYSSLVGRPTESKTFFARRFHRIYPPYIIAVILFFLKVVAIESIKGRPIPAWEIGQMIFFNTTLLQVIMGKITVVNPAFWSLCVEMQFYLVVGLILSARKVSKLAGNCIGCFLLLVSISIKFFYDGGQVPIKPDTWFIFFPNYVNHFALGASLAWIACNRERIAELRLLQRLAHFLPTIFACLLLFVSERYGWCIALVMVISVTLEVAGQSSIPYKMINNPVFRFMGIRSYSIYLIHGFGIVAMSTLGARQMANHPFIGILCLVATWVVAIGAGWLYYRWVEQKFMNRRKPSLPSAGASHHVAS